MHNSNNLDLLGIISRCHLHLANCKSQQDIWPTICSEFMNLLHISRVYVMEVENEKLKQASAVCEISNHNAMYVDKNMPMPYINWLLCDETVELFYKHKACYKKTSEIQHPQIKQELKNGEVYSCITFPVFVFEELKAWICFETQHEERIVSKEKEFVIIDLAMSVALWLEKNHFILKSNAINETLKLSLEASKSGFWNITLGVSEPNYYFSENIFTLLGLKKESNQPDFAAFEQMLHPDDINVASQMLRFISQNSKLDFNEEFRIRHVQGHWVWLKANGKMIRNADGLYSFIGVLTDVSKLKNSQLKLKRTNEILHAINEVQHAFQFNHDFQKSIEKLLKQTLKVTECAFGFIGEVYEDEKGDPYLKTHALTNISWDKATNDLYKKHHKEGLEFRNLNTLFGKVLTTKQLVISNDPKNDERAGGVPVGHPDLFNFLGIPIMKNNEMVGMFGLANNNDGMSMEILDRMSPLINGYANFIAALRISREKNKTQELYDLIAENTLDTIALHKPDSTFEYVSPSITKTLGYTPDEVIGKKPSELFGIKNEPVNVLTENKLIIEHKHKEGHLVTTEILIKPILNKHGEMVRYLAATRDVTERERILRELEAALNAEKEASLMKSRFVSFASHGFRTPIATIMSSTELVSLILKQFGSQELSTKIGKHLDRMNNEVNRLNMLLNDILILEKQSLGKYQIKLKPLNIVSFLHNIYSEFYANKNELRVFDLPTEDTKVMINTDNQLLTHVLTNLIDNALKYSPLHTPIKLSIKVLPKTVEISVADQGIGVPENEKSKLFESFFRASNVNYISGTGLGLSIVKQFVTILNGSIDFESQLGKGTRFCVTLPRSID